MQVIKKIALSSILKQASSQPGHFTYITDNCKPSKLIYKSANKPYLDKVKQLKLAAQDMVTQFTLTNPESELITTLNRVKIVTGDARKLDWIPASSVNSDMIYQDMQEMRVDDLTVLKALHLFGWEFLFEKQHLPEKTVKQRLCLMSKAAVKLEDYRLDEIPQSALIMARRKLGPSGDDCYRYLAEFIHHLQVSHKYIGDNPIEKYYEKHPR